MNCVKNDKHRLYYIIFYPTVAARSFIFIYFSSASRLTCYGFIGIVLNFSMQTSWRICGVTYTRYNGKYKIKQWVWTLYQRINRCSHLLLILFKLILQLSPFISLLYMYPFFLSFPLYLFICLSIYLSIYLRLLIFSFIPAPQSIYLSLYTPFLHFFLFHDPRYTQPSVMRETPHQ